MSPNPIPLDYDNSFLSKFKTFIDIPKSKLTENDYEFVAVICEKEDGTSVYRNDLNANEIKSKLNSDNEWINVVVDYQGEKPYKWIFWPYSTTKGWCEKIERVI